MSRNVVAPTEHRDGDGVTLRHPAFAQVTVFKTSGDHTLYGSDIQHPYSISLRIHHSELQRKYSTDRYRADHRPFAEIRLSMSQWAQMVSSIGDGVGTPATLVFKDGETIPGIAYESRTNEFKRESKETLDGVLNELKTLRADLLAGTSGLSKTKQAAMVDRVTAAMRKVSDSLPFIEETFVEHLEGLKTQAAIEINAMMSDARNAQSAIGGRAPLDLLEHRGEGADER